MLQKSKNKFFYFYESLHLQCLCQFFFLCLGQSFFFLLLFPQTVLKMLCVFMSVKVMNMVLNNPSNQIGIVPYQEYAQRLENQYYLSENSIGLRLSS